MAALHYPRAVVDTALYNRNNKSVVAGDIVFVERTDPNAKRRGKVEHAQNIRVYTMAQVNAKFANRRIACVDGEPPTGHELFHEFSIDGVVHSVDEEPQEREDLGQFTIAQTAVHGACRMTLSAEDAKHVKKGFSIHGSTPRPSRAKPASNAASITASSSPLSRARFCISSRNAAASSMSCSSGSLAASSAAVSGSSQRWRTIVP